MYFCAVEIFANKRIDNGMELLELILIYSFPSLEFWERIRAMYGNRQPIPFVTNQALRQYNNFN